MDSTYKTNRYKLPLLDVVVVTPNSQTVSLAYAFLSEESDKDYTWSLQQFRSRLGKLFGSRNITVVVDRELALIAGIRAVFFRATVKICIWYVNKNVQEKAKSKVRHRNCQISGDTWLNKHKEQFTAAWTRDVSHFGHSTTSRVEGIHAYLKHWIGVSTLDLDEVYTNLVLAGETQRR
ncbi:hypothetical protein PsorP6_013105 [Peronosclerospora sorghi]|uniref:Uncharacterized protein n=1 Tax=Peronosclerospora sorghi TaxID=230839 RepID=A0ACC0WFR4_9STRA|nr:hypothetical protein PsorP6_013105 [Peronosclerospora sorghi]